MPRLKASYVAPDPPDRPGRASCWSAATHHGRGHEAMQEGAADFILKPFSLRRCCSSTRWRKSASRPRIATGRLREGATALVREGVRRRLGKLAPRADDPLAAEDLKGLGAPAAPPARPSSRDCGAGGGARRQLCRPHPQPGRAAGCAQTARVRLGSMCDTRSCGSAGRNGVRNASFPPSARFAARRAFTTPSGRCSRASQATPP